MADSQKIGEFELIAKYFAPLARHPGAFALTDDAAVLTCSPGQQLVLTKDMMAEGTHFPFGAAPESVARKLLRVNLSDLAAMGATPIGYLIGLGLPKSYGAPWAQAFAAGLMTDQNRFGISLLGGDTIGQPDQLTVSLTAVGEVPNGQALRRSGARPGDKIFVSGTIGDGYLGLLAQRGEADDPDGFLRNRYNLPEPRIDLGTTLRGIASAAIDVSDGLIADLNHLCETSKVGAEIRLAKVPFSPAALQNFEKIEEFRLNCLSGGDDYELLVAVGRGDAGRLPDTGVPLTEIGEFTAGGGVTVLDDDGVAVKLPKGGFTHF